MTYTKEITGKLLDQGTQQRSSYSLLLLLLVFLLADLSERIKMYK